MSVTLRQSIGTAIAVWERIMERKSKAFTLVELLVVLAIITILASILFPALAQARRAAHKTVCLSNQRQLTFAVLMYTEDEHGTFPGYVQDTWYRQGDTTPIWTGMVSPYLKSEGVHVCPSASQETKFGALWGQRGWPSLGLNTNFGLWIWGGEPIRINESEIEKPAKNVLLADSMPGDHRLGYRGYITNAWNPREGQCGVPIVINGVGAVLSDRHNRGTNVALVDGHARWYPIEQLVPNRAPSIMDWCHCVVDANAAGLKWLVHYRCSTD
ncbi:MAG TPA: type II secretion system protein [Fimbriimonadaceae bacterium]|nr:type II secretion system protein [Fimbriimonadaceae bacterium]HRJ97859.1 type II secretion system protein [Fimbriimonadaceae bacterium]